MILKKQLHPTGSGRRAQAASKHPPQPSAWVVTVPSIYGTWHPPTMGSITKILFLLLMPRETGRQCSGGETVEGHVLFVSQKGGITSCIRER